jgi:hypothetical protein
MRADFGTTITRIRTGSETGDLIIQVRGEIDAFAVKGPWDCNTVGREKDCGAEVPDRKLDVNAILFIIIFCVFSHSPQGSLVNVLQERLLIMWLEMRMERVR